MKELIRACIYMYYNVLTGYRGHTKLGLVSHCGQEKERGEKELETPRRVRVAKHSTRRSHQHASVTIHVLSLGLID